jgi:hypothetical protein
MKNLNRIIIGANTVDDGVSDVQTNNPIRITGSTYDVADHNPVAGSVINCARIISGRTFPAFVADHGTEIIPQSSLWRRSCGLIKANPSSTTFYQIGWAPTTMVGTATARAITTGTTRMSYAARVGFVSGATAGSLCGLYANNPMFAVTTGKLSVAGFLYHTRFAVSDAAAVTAARMFCGLQSNVSAPTNVEPSTLTNCIGVAQLSTDSTQLYLVYGGSAAQTPIPLGTNFPPRYSGTTTAGTLVDLTLYCDDTNSSEAGVIRWRVEMAGTNTINEGVITPTSVGVQTPGGSLLSPRWWRTNNKTALAVGIDIVSGYWEQDW